MKKSTAGPKNMDEYIAAFPEDVQIILQNVRATIHKAAPDAVETISYKMPTFTLNDRYLVYFSGFKKHISLFPAPRGDDQFKQELAGYAGGTGTVQFPLDEAIPYGLITRIVKFRVKENQEKQMATKTNSKASTKTTTKSKSATKPAAPKKAAAAGASAASKQITDYIEGLGDWRGKMLAQLRKAILKAGPGLTEEWKWGTPVFSLNGNVVAISAFQDHTKVNFFKGAQLKDTKKVFNAGLDAKTTRSIDYFQGDKIDERSVQELVKQAVALNTGKK